jgi:hypothetical protein
MSLTQEHVVDICLLHEGSRCCRYLMPCDDNPGQFNCLKHKKELKSKIDKLVKEEKIKPQPNPNQILPLGDNCQGYPVLKHISQGYNVK